MGSVVCNFRNQTSASSLFAIDCGMVGLVAYVGQCSLSIYMLNNFFIPDLTFFNTDCLVVGNGFLWQFLVVALLTAPIVAACVWVRAMSKHNKILKHIFC